jgi:hypothetical protein
MEFRPPVPPVWLRGCAGHAFYERGEAIISRVSLPLSQWKEYERRGFRYVDYCRDSADYAACTYRKFYRLDNLVTFTGSREVLRGHWTTRW